jgi:hypothetical protein
MKKYLLLTAVAASACAHAYFRDDFDGNQINWNNWSLYVERPAGIYHTVSNGMLHVTGMHYPYGPETVRLTSKPYQATPDPFKVSVRVGWEDLDGYFVFGVLQGGVSEVWPANMYAFPGWAGVSNGPSVPAPREGFVTLSIEREKRPGNTNYYWFYVDGVLIYEALRTIQRDDYFKLYIGFGAPSESSPMSFYVDWAEFVPEPTSLSALALGAGALILRRRKRRR